MVVLHTCICQMDMKMLLDVNYHLVLNDSLSRHLQVRGISFIRLLSLSVYIFDKSGTAVNKVKSLLKS